ncbi:hypothetical protein IFM89_022493 [Coptis chinensis]|uniref:Prolamin-like domain-containing protein n=1 Tax=Coptis chinensis TaxID=261450 RepID=A0A835ICW7_9MAGN|nr:hypothetical protein IFM89_022493 [Coptis chinensis]
MDKVKKLFYIKLDPVTEDSNNGHVAAESLESCGGNGAIGVAGTTNVAVFPQTIVASAQNSGGSNHDQEYNEDVSEGFTHRNMCSDVCDCPFSSPITITPAVWDIATSSKPRYRTMLVVFSKHQRMFCGNLRLFYWWPSWSKAITDINSSCWPNMFPFNPGFPPSLQKTCAKGAPSDALTPKGTTSKTIESSAETFKVASAPSDTKAEDDFLVAFGRLLAPDVGKCLSSLHKTEGCVLEVITSFFSFEVGILCRSCCEAVKAIDKNCLPKIFPFKPFFPPLLQHHCANVVHRT